MLTAGPDSTRCLAPILPDSALISDIQSVCISGFRKSHAALGGDKCDIPAVGSGPGASSTCTSTENGFCLLDHLTVTGNSPVTAVQFDGKCVCYYGYSGPKCATKSTFSFIYSIHYRRAKR